MFACGDLIEDATILATQSELYYSFELIAESSVSVDLLFLDADGDLDLYLYDGDCTALNQLASSTSTTDNELIYDDCLPIGVYYVKVRNYSSNDVVFDLGLDCNDCVADPDPCEPFATAMTVECGDVIEGTNDLDCLSSIDTYDCVGWNEGGPEVAYSLFLPVDQIVTIDLDYPSGGDLDLFLLGSQDPTDCILHGDTGLTTECLTAGIYYVVVDGYNGAVNSYTLSITCTDCGTQEDPCEDLVCTPIVLDENGHWEIQSNNVDAPDIIDYDYASTGEVCFSITLEEPMALEMNTFFPYTEFDTNSYFYAEYMPCDEEYDEATNYIGWNDGASAEDWMTHVFIGDCEAMMPAGTYYILISGYYSSSIGNFEMHVDAIDCTPASADETPVDFALSQNYPNPFNPTTNIDFTVETGMVNLAVYNLAGQQVATLVDGMVEAGTHTVTFDASNLTSGVYFYTLTANGVSTSQKMVLVR